MYAVRGGRVVVFGSQRGEGCSVWNYTKVVLIYQIDKQ